MLLSHDSVASPTMEGPNVPPMSPANARRANNAVPPSGMRADVRLMEPGHMMATARPLTMQPIKAMSGTDASDAVR